MRGEERSGEEMWRRTTRSNWKGGRRRGARGLRDEVLDNRVENANVAERHAKPLEARLNGGGRRRVELRQCARRARAARIGRVRALGMMPAHALLRAAAARARRLGRGALGGAIRRVAERQQRRQTQLPTRQLVLSAVARGAAITTFEAVVLEATNEERQRKIRSSRHEKSSELQCTSFSVNLLFTLSDFLLMSELIIR